MAEALSVFRIKYDCPLYKCIEVTLCILKKLLMLFAQKSYWKYTISFSLTCTLKRTHCYTLTEWQFHFWQPEKYKGKVLPCNHSKKYFQLEIELKGLHEQTHLSCGMTNWSCTKFVIDNNIEFLFQNCSWSTGVFQEDFSLWHLLQADFIMYVRKYNPGKSITFLKSCIFFHLILILQTR